MSIAGARRFVVAMSVSVAVGGPLASGVARAADPSEIDGEAGFEFRAVRIEHISAAVIYRLHEATGEVCAFSFPQASPGALRGCAGGVDGSGAVRFTLDALPGARSTGQSSAYRLDRETGEVCRFRLPSTEAALLEKAGCVGLAAH